MKIEELMPKIREGAKVTSKSIADLDFMYFVVNDIASDRYEFGSAEPYTGFIAVIKGDEYEYGIDGAAMIVDDWEMSNG